MLEEASSNSSGNILAIISLIVSLIAIVIGLLNFNRDKYKIVVDLDWDSGSHYVGMQPNVVEKWGAIIVTNQGRRPVYIRTIGIKYPDDERVLNLLSEEKNEGVKLDEGNSPIIIRIPHDGHLKRYAKDWKKLSAVAYDVAGKEYKSGRPWETPSWVE